MNDRFKFRAWFEERFIYKSLCDSNVYTDDNKCICLANILPNLPWEQCTGLKDKNGNLIYEGDIVYPGYVVERRFDGYMLPTGRQLDFYDGSCQIIGNIHENKDLLGEE